jgi:hypothetical protein
MKKIPLFVVLALISVAGGCAGTLTPGDAYVKADRLTKRSIEPVLEMTKADHPDLAPDIDRVMKSWETRLDSAEAVISK